MIKVKQLRSTGKPTKSWLVACRISARRGPQTGLWEVTNDGSGSMVAHSEVIVGPDLPGAFGRVVGKPDICLAAFEGDSTSPVCPLYGQPSDAHLA